MVTVLVADDDPNTHYLIDLFCRGRDGLHLEFSAHGQNAFDRVAQGDIDIVISDVRMPLMSGDELLSALKKHHPKLPVIIMTSYGTIEDAVSFLHRGAEDYLTKPLTKQVFMHRLERVIERVALAAEVKKLRNDSRGPELIGQSRPIQELRMKLPTIAQTEASIVIYGESGTGKEVVARTIHDQSRRREGPFVTVNCGSLPETLLESELFGYRRGAFTDARVDTPGLVEAADKGTLFLDEIGEISPTVQVKLLRFLQLKEYKPLGSPKPKIADVRIVAATNRDLKRAVAEGRFREDLYYRLDIVSLVVPRLCDRPGDIPLLAQHFLERSCRRLGRPVVFQSTEVLRRLEAHRFPGNVRELENKIESLVAMAVDGVIRPENVEFEAMPTERTTTPSPAAPLTRFRAEKARALAEFERTYLVRLLAETNGHLSQAAEKAGLDRKNLWQLLRKHELGGPRRRRRGRSLGSSPAEGTRASSM